MDRFVAHCVATAVITAALAAASTVRAESSGAEAAPATTTATTAPAAFTRTPVGPADADRLSGAFPAARVPGVSVPMIPAPAPAGSATAAPSVLVPTVSMPVASPLSPDNPLPAAAGLDTDLASGVSKGAVCADAYQVGPTAYAHWHGEIIFSIKQYYSPSCHARYSYAYPWLQFREQDAAYDVGLAVFDTTHDALDGAVTYVDGIGSPNYWSAPVAVPRGGCTEATAHLFLPDDETDTYSQRFCS